MKLNLTDNLVVVPLKWPFQIQVQSVQSKLCNWFHWFFQSSEFSSFKKIFDKTKNYPFNSFGKKQNFFVPSLNLNFKSESKSKFQKSMTTFWRKLDPDNFILFTPTLKTKVIPLRFRDFSPLPKIQQSRTRSKVYSIWNLTRFFFSFNFIIFEPIKISGVNFTTFFQDTYFAYELWNRKSLE